MQVVVTGGAGFIGSHIVEALAAEGASVRVVDIAPSDSSIDGLAADVTRADVRDERALTGLLAGADVVCHQAAKVGLGVSFDDVSDYVSHNDLGTATLLRALYYNGFKGRIVLAGSMVVYGEGAYRCPAHGSMRPRPRSEEALKEGDFDPRCDRCGSHLSPQRVTEESSTDPRNVYAATKLHQEHLCFVFGREMSVPVAALRYHNVYGPRMPLDTPYAGVASIFKSAFESGIAPRVFEDGEQRRDFVHVRDVAKANVICCLRDEPASGVFNIASGEVRTVLDLAEALRAGYGEEAKSPIVTGDYRLGDVRHIFAANERAARDLGFRSSVSFSTGMAEFAMVTTNSLPHDAIMTTETVKLPKK